MVRSGTIAYSARLWYHQGLHDRSSVVYLGTGNSNDADGHAILSYLVQDWYRNAFVVDNVSYASGDSHLVIQALRYVSSLPTKDK